jgi:hypothetical protein
MAACSQLVQHKAVRVAKLSQIYQQKAQEVAAQAQTQLARDLVQVVQMIHLTVDQARMQGTAQAMWERVKEVRGQGQVPVAMPRLASSRASSKVVAFQQQWQEVQHLPQGA